jgi:type I restriction enzyme, S subunit
MTNVQVPPGWHQATLGDVASLVRNGIFARRPTDEPNGVPILRISAVRNGRIDMGEMRYVTDLASETISKYAIQPGDLLFTRYNGSRSLVGRCARVPEHEGPVVHPDKLIRVVPQRDLVDGRFLALLAESESVRRFLEPRIKTTAGQSGITGKDVRAIPICYPELAEQRRIVDVLEDHLSRLDAADKYLDAGARRSDLMYQGVLRAAIQGRLAPRVPATHHRARQLELRAALCPPNMKRGRPSAAQLVGNLERCPEHWVQVSLEEATHPVRTISYGILKPGPDIDNGVPYVRVINMRNDVLSLSDLRKTTPEIAAQYSRASLVAGDVLISIRGTYGRVSVVPEELNGGNITQDTARLAFLDPVEPEFAAIYLRSPQAQTFLKRVARGVAVKGVNIADLRTMPFPIPPIPEQRAMIMRVDELSSDIENARQAADLTRQRTASLRRALLDAAFSGRLLTESDEGITVEEMANV